MRRGAQKEARGKILKSPHPADKYKIRENFTPFH
jgi:hypothetical protein